MSTFHKVLTIIICIFALSLTACNLPSNATPTPAHAINTAVAQTVIAQLTQDTTGQATPVAQTPVIQPSPTSVLVQPTNPPQAQPSPTPIRPTATAIVLPTNTPIPPTATPIPVPCDRAHFEEDVTFPDGNDVPAGSSFIKTWRLKNTGACTWNSSYSLVFQKGESMLPSGSPAAYQLTTGVIAPGQTIDVSVTLKAPDKPGTYQGFWLLRNGAGVLFGIGDNAEKSFWVKVDVIDAATPTPNAAVQFDFIAKGPSAEWHNASSILPWGDPNDDTPGVAVSVENVKLNNDKTYAKVLATYPQRVNDGQVWGIFPGYTVQDKDRFRTLLGFRSSCGEANVKFQLKYRDGNNEVIVGEWLKSCDNKALDIDLDLSSLKGKTLQFILLVSTNGSPNDDRAIWVAPRIEH